MVSRWIGLANGFIGRRLSQFLRWRFNPGCCWSCLLPLQATEVDFCTDCLAQLPRLPPVNIRALATTPERVEVCRYWFCGFYWHGVIAGLIADFKFKQQPVIAKRLAPLLAAHVIRCYQNADQPLPDVLVAMPQSARGWRRRGYNQAALLAQATAHYLQIEYRLGVIRKLAGSAEQHKLSAQQRWQNLKFGFYCRESMQGKRVAIIDDVLTTGASVSGVAIALRKRGALSVDAWAVAFTPPPSTFD